MFIRLYSFYSIRLRNAELYLEVLACIAFSQQSNSFQIKKQYSRGGAMIAAAAAASNKKGQCFERWGMVKERAPPRRMIAGVRAASWDGEWNTKPPLKWTVTTGRTWPDLVNRTGPDLTGPQLKSLFHSKSSSSIMNGLKRSSSSSETWLTNPSTSAGMTAWYERLKKSYTRNFVYSEEPGKKCFTFLLHA